MKLSEPVTAITDFLLSVECTIFLILLFSNSDCQVSIWLWSAAFLALAAGSLTGGLFHGLRDRFSDPALLRLWRITGFSLIAGFIFFAAGGIYSATSGSARILVLIASGLLLVFAAIGVARHTTAHAVGRDFFPYLIAVLLLLGVLLAWRLLSTTSASAGTNILAGSWICVLGMAVQQREVRVGPNFNQNDLCHIIFFAGLYFLYAGGTYLRD